MPSFVCGGGWNADPNLPMVVSAEEVVVVFVWPPEEEEEKNGRKAPGGKGSLGSTKWCRPNGLGCWAAVAAAMCDRNGSPANPCDPDPAAAAAAARLRPLKGLLCRSFMSPWIGVEIGLSFDCF